MGLPPSFRTFQSNQQQVLNFRSLYQSQVPFPVNHPWANMANESFAPMMNNNNAHVEQHKGAKHRAQSVDPNPRNNPSVHSSNIPQQPATVMEHYHHHHHHHRHRPHPTNNVGPSVEHEKGQNVSSV
jgi:hypothetical protein